MTSETVGLLEAAIKQLNPDALIIQSEFGKVDPKKIMNTGLFDFEKASSTSGWQQELQNEHTPETEEYGISSFVFRSKKPFHPDRWFAFLNKQYPSNIIRAKGLFWLASRSSQAINFSQAGGSLRIESAGLWWCSMPYEERIQYTAYHDYFESIEQKWDKTWGDRENELVFIGQHLDKEKCHRELEKCLLTDAEAEDWNHKLWEDAFPENM